MKRSGALRRKWPVCSVIGAAGSGRVSEQQPRLFLRRLADSVQQKSRVYPALLTHILHLRTNSRYQNLFFLHVTSCGDTGVRAKMAQETRIKFSRIPYTIVRSTQFFEFVGSIAQSATEGATVRLPSVLMQPIESDGSVPSRCRPGKPIRRHSGHFRGPTNSMKLPSGSMSLDCVHGRRI